MDADKKIHIDKKIYGWILLLSAALCFLFAFSSHGGDDKEEKIVRVGYPVQEGFTEITEEGEYRGYTYDYLQEIAQYANWKYEYVTPEGDFNTQLTELLSQLEKGEIDILGAMVYSDELAEQYSYCGYSYGTAHSTLEVLENNSRYNDFNYSTYDTIRVAVVSRSGKRDEQLDEFAKMNNFKAVQVMCDSEADQIRLLENGAADAALRKDAIFGEENLRVIASFAPVPFYFATTKGNTEVLNSLNRALSTINETNPYYMASVYEKYFAGDAHTLLLTAAEQEYVKNSPVLNVAALSGKAPLQYTARDGSMKGLTCDVLDYISAQTGLEFRVVKAETYEEYREIMERGETELVAGANSDYSLNVDQKYALTIPYVYVPLMIAVNEKNADPNNLAGKTLALMDGIEYKGGYQGEVKYYKNIGECMAAVHRGDADYCYGNSYSIQYYINRNGYKNINTFVQAERWSQNQCMGVMKPVDMTLLSILNKSIKSLSDEQIQRLLYANAFNPSDQGLLDYMRANPNQVVTAGIFLAMMTGLVIFFAGQYNRRTLRARKALENQRYEQLSELSNEFLYEYDVAEDRLKLTDQSAEFLGCEKVIENLKKQAEAGNLFRQIIQVSGNNREMECVLPNGEKRWLRLTSKTVSDAVGRPVYSVGKLVDIQQAQEMKEQLLEKARKDGLTRLYNAVTSRQMITDILGKMDKEEVGALLIMDIDYFKDINDHLGHYTGDAVLQEVAGILLEVFSSGGVVGRLGGDEFVVFMDKVTGVSQIEEKCRELSQKVGDITQREQGRRVTLSIGVARTDWEREYDRLYRLADRALYVVKGRGRDGFEII